MPPQHVSVANITLNKKKDPGSNTASPTKSKHSISFRFKSMRKPSIIRKNDSKPQDDPTNISEAEQHSPTIPEVTILKAESSDGQLDGANNTPQATEKATINPNNALTSSDKNRKPPTMPQGIPAQRAMQCSGASPPGSVARNRWQKVKNVTTAVRKLSTRSKGSKQNETNAAIAEEEIEETVEVKKIDNNNVHGENSEEVLGATSVVVGKMKDR